MASLSLLYKNSFLLKPFCDLSLATLLALLCAVLCLVALSYLILCDPTNYSPPGSSVYRDSPGKNTGVDSHGFLQGILPNQVSNPALLHCKQILYHPSHQESPRLLEWVTYPFSRGSSQPRNQTRVSCLADRFFYQLSYSSCPCM